MNGQIDAGLHFLDLRGIDIHHDFAGRSREIGMRKPSHRHVQTSADREHEVGILKCEICSSGCDTPGSAGTKFIRVRHKVQSHPGSENRDAEEFPQLDKLLNRIGQSDSVSGD
jgi:hypothetical protein